MAKSKLKISAIELRKNGESIKQIAQILEISSSTVSIWCKDIQLTKNQISILEKRQKDPMYSKRLENSLKQRELRIEREKTELEKGRKLIGNLSGRDLMVIGAALYWAEGFKKDKMVGFANSDPKMIQVFLNWLRLLDVNKEDFRFRIVVNQSHVHRIEAIEAYWISVLNINRKHFYKPTFQKSIQKKLYENPEEYFGVMRVRVLKSTNLLRRIKGMINQLGN